MEIGNVVQLKSGGPKMTVTALQKEHVECTWFARSPTDGIGSPLFFSFPVQALLKTKGD